MTDNRHLDIALCWQMQVAEAHKRDGIREISPRTLLHVIGVYTDMLTELEQASDIAVTLLVSPELLQSIDHQAGASRRYFAEGISLPAPLLGMLVTEVLEERYRSEILELCLTGLRGAFSERHPQCRELLARAAYLRRQTGALDQVEDAFFHRLLVWYHLDWLAASVRRLDPRIRRLLESSQSFSIFDRLSLLHVITEQFENLIPRLRDLADSGKVDLGFLGGHARADRVRDDMACFESLLGRMPAVYWFHGQEPDGATLRLLERCGIAWIGGIGDPTSPCPAAARSPARFAREELLCRMIESSYREWPAEDAVANCVRRLEDIADRPGRPPGTPVALVIRDGRHWDRYPDGGSDFRQTLYRSLSSHPRLHVTTFHPPLGPQDRSVLPGGSATA